jgi:hypothetical protein
MLYFAAAAEVVELSGICTVYVSVTVWPELADKRRSEVALAMLKVIESTGTDSSCDSAVLTAFCATASSSKLSGIVIVRLPASVVEATVLVVVNTVVETGGGVGDGSGVVEGGVEG